MFLYLLSLPYGKEVIVDMCGFFAEYVDLYNDCLCEWEKSIYLKKSESCKTYIVRSKITYFIRFSPMIHYAVETKR